MRTLTVDPSPGVPEGDRPLTTDGLTLVDQPTLVLGPDREPLAALLGSADVAPVMVALKAAVRRIGCHKLARPGGLTSESRTFGNAARMPARGFDSCRSCTAAVDHPEEHAVLCNAAGYLWRHLQSASIPGVNERLTEAADGILPAWRLPGAPWTSGIVNRSSALTWHRDRNNTPGVWQLLVTFRHHMQGGLTVVPELGLAFAAGDGDLIAFPGQQWWHGVTALHPTRSDGYRYSIVYYQVGAMRSCLPPAEEQARAAAVRTDREALWAGVESGDPSAIARAAEQLGLDVAEFMDLRRAQEID